ncbi:MAG: hypothetical protein Q9183_007183 [Haloplaca sp. 2 TL-2023]
MGAICDPAAWTSSAIGEMPGSIEIKLVDCPDLKYFSSHSPTPQGEIWIRGAAVADGYLDLEQETKEAFTADGWFKTGDIGEFDENGLLRVIDRKKNMVKTLNGEYIALEKLESIYRSSNLVANICVYAAEDKQKPIAIVVPVEAAFKNLAKANGIDDCDSIEDLVENKRVRDLALVEIQKQGRSGGLMGIEIVDGIVVAREEWTPANGLVTSAQKVNRKIILEKYRGMVDEVYKS